VILFPIFLKILLRTIGLFSDEIGKVRKTPDAKEQNDVKSLQTKGNIAFMEKRFTDAWSIYTKVYDNVHLSFSFIII